MLTEKTFTRDGISINYVEGPPSGVPLVLLHGVTTRWQTFLPILPALTARYTVFALDLRGHGKSSRSIDGYAVSNDVADIVAFINSRVGAPAALLGWSLGANISLLVGATAPELVRAIILEDPPLSALTDDDPNEATFFERFRAYRSILLMDGPESDKLKALASVQPVNNDLAVRKSYSQLRHTDPEILTCILEHRKWEGNRLDTLLPNVKCPVLLVQADAALGAALDDSTAQIALSLLSDCVHVYLPNVGHNVHVANPTAFVQMVFDFLET
jgi:pimeloyl-ACP methyl ester carboxylesterase